MKAQSLLIVMIVAVALLTGVTFQEQLDARQDLPLEEAIVGVWKFPVDGYYIGFDRDGRVCYGGSEESVYARRWCNDYTLQDDILTETCMGGPEDRNCPLGSGSCKAKVSVSNDGQLTYRILYDHCNMLPYKTVPPREYSFIAR